jgi:hypothetical protein
LKRGVGPFTSAFGSPSVEELNIPSFPPSFGRSLGCLFQEHLARFQQSSWLSLPEHLTPLTRAFGFTELGHFVPPPTSAFGYPLRRSFGPSQEHLAPSSPERLAAPPLSGAIGSPSRKHLAFHPPSICPLSRRIWLSLDRAFSAAGSTLQSPHAGGPPQSPATASPTHSSPQPPPALMLCISPKVFMGRL